MITDALLQTEASRVDVRAAGTYVSANTIDLSVARDIGSGAPVKMLWNIEVAYVGGTSISFQQIISAAAGLGSPVVIDQTPAIPVANLVLGGMVVRFVPEQLGGAGSGASGFGGVGGLGLRYFGTQEVGVGTFTAGQHSARLVNDVIDVKHYPGGFVIL